MWDWKVIFYRDISFIYFELKSSKKKESDESEKSGWIKKAGHRKIFLWVKSLSPVVLFHLYADDDAVFAIMLK